jgi:uncharacterized protein (DUF427 family)
MGLMTGTGPLGRAPAGQFNFTPPEPGMALYLHPTPKRIRVVVAGETVADSRRAMLLHEGGHQPVYYFPPDDVRTDLLAASEHRTHCPKKGDASHFTFGPVENVAWSYPDTIPGAPPELGGLIAFYWDRVEHWYEEDEEVFGHPRDPYHRVDIIPSSSLVRIALGGTELAATERAMVLFETGLTPRYYFPREDVSCDLEPSDTTTRCPYKGIASYHSVGVERRGKDLVWYYAAPFDEARRITGLLCFWNERVDIELDGVAQARPASPWAGRAASRALNAPPAVTRG